jgi:hypothetical protein
MRRLRARESRFKAGRCRNVADGMESMMLPSSLRSSKEMRPWKFDSTRAEILLSDKSRVRRDRRPQNECLQIAGTNELMIFSCSNFSKLWIKQTIIKKLIQKKFPGRLGRKWLWHDRVGLIRIVKLTHGSWCLMHRSFYTLAPQRSLQPLIRKSSLPSCQWYRAV